MENKLKIIGIISLILGAAAALLCILPHGLFLAIFVGFIGLLCSTVYVFIDSRYEINSKKITPGIIAMALSSIPVLFLLAIIIMSKVNR